MYNYNVGNVSGVQSVFQPGFAGTDVQQVRNQIARDGGFGYNSVQGGFATGVPAGFQNNASFQSGVSFQSPVGGAQAVFQPGFAGTDVQQVRNQIARDGGFGYNSVQSGFGAGVPVQSAGFQGNASFQTAGVGFQGGGVQAIFQPGFAGTDPQQVRNQISRDGGFGYNSVQSNFGAGVPVQSTGFQGNTSFQTAGVGFQGGGVQAVFQPGFAGTDVQQVRNQIARDGGFGYNVGQAGFSGGNFQSGYQANAGYQTAGVGFQGSNAQAVFQPGFAGTDVQQVRNQIARDGGFGYNSIPTGYAAGVPTGF
ncbi:hypothetical protein [Brevibacillus fulvus]|uniref:Uncharacterized protein n=1 Tax=Brevibacillus fulvus TaxID=1125967 RepID=A0A939BNQ4_9BACL|nr:hypothetical protein [Brevibacillus fulvus]MBM7589455.1 hypothetical protein [Brevibacillus fulvus]